MPELSECIAALEVVHTDEANAHLIHEQIPIYSEVDICIGRDAEKCNLAIDNDIVSKRHFRIYSIVYGIDEETDLEEPPLIYCEDLESVNGTWVNDVLIGKIGYPWKGHLLCDGDLIQIKPHWTFQFHQNFSEVKKDVDEVQETEMQTFSDHYTIHDRVLGRGMFGRVHLAYDNFTKSQLACKIVDLRNLKPKCCPDEESPHFVKPEQPADRKRRISATRQLSRMLQEINILAKLDHPNVVSLKKAFRSENTLFLFQELATGGDLFSYLESQPDGKLSDLYSRIIIRQVALAIQYVHAQGVVHRDVKLENILVTHTDIGHRVLLTDFGSSAMVSKRPSRMISYVGTQGYHAPEINSPQVKEEGYTMSIDMWSLGVVTACLLTGCFPLTQQEGLHYDRESPALLQRIEEMHEGKAQWKDVGSRALDFLKKLLVIEPEDRMTADQAVTHCWFTKPRKVAEEIELLRERANQHWRPRQETSILVDLPTQDSPSRPSKRQRRIPDTTNSAYHGLERHLNPKKRPVQRKKILANFKKHPKQKFLPDGLPSSPERPKPNMRAKVKPKKYEPMIVPGNDLFGHKSRSISPDSQLHSDDASEAETELCSSDNNPHGNYSATTQHIRYTGEHEETQKIEGESQDRQLSLLHSHNSRNSSATICDLENSETVEVLGDVSEDESCEKQFLADDVDKENNVHPSPNREIQDTAYHNLHLASSDAEDSDGHEMIQELRRKLQARLSNLQDLEATEGSQGSQQLQDD